MFKKILLPVNLEDTSLAAQALDIAVAEARRGNGRLRILTVVPGFGMPLVETYFPKNAYNKALREVATRLQAYIEDSIPEDIKVTPKIAQGTPWEKIVRHARTMKADLVVVPSHDRKRSGELLIGSCAAKVAEHAHCTVMVVRS